MTGSRPDIIKLTGVSKVYSFEDIALNGLEFSIAQGEFVFIAGRSGAGKSTLLKLLYGSERATQGSVIVGGRDLSNVSAAVIARLRRSVGFVFRDTKLLSDRSVLDNVGLALEVQGVNRQETINSAREILAAFGLENSCDVSPLSLSSEEKQRVGLARALIGRPKILLADDPSGSLDQASSRAIFDILLEANSCGVTVVVASSNLGLIEAMSKRTLVLDNGRLTSDFAGSV